MKSKMIKAVGMIAFWVAFATAFSARASDAPYCGDGIVQPPEECDDGNFVNGDGCSSYCTKEDLTPPTVTSVSIPDGTKGVSNLTKQLTVTFSEPVNPASITIYNIVFKEYNKPLNIDLKLDDSKTKLTINILDDLKGDQDYGLIIEKVKDVAGNINLDRFVSTFTTGTFIDVVPPTVVARPEGGAYNVTQAVSLTPYVGKLTFSDDYIDKGAKIYYTLDGSTPSKNGLVYSIPLTIKKNLTLKYIGIDAAGNQSQVYAQTYTFGCADHPNAKTVTNYPECKVTECEYGFLLKSNVCVINLSQDPDDYKANAITAPFFGSDTPMTISTRPALYITPEHKGIIPRPIHFVDLQGGTIIDLARDTHITRPDGTPFTGYLRPPSNLYSKSFPINFGYSFKSIFHLEPAEGGDLHFNPMIKITIPFTDRYDPEEKITVFTYDSNTEEYFVHDPSLVSVNSKGDAVTITADSTGTFFVAQPGQDYNAIVFQDTVDHWAKNYIEQLYRWGDVKGKAKGVFAPDDPLSRAEFTKIALNAMGEKVDPTEELEDAPFPDVPVDSWSAPYIKKAKDLGLIKGDPTGYFKPDDPINRVDAIKILMQAFHFVLTSVGQRTDKFQDVPTWEWYFPPLNFALQNHLIDGLRSSNGTINYDFFGPDQPIKRGEMAKLTVKAIQLKNGALRK